MKKTISWILLLSLIWFVIIGNTSNLYSQKQKITIAVLTIQTKGGVSTNEAATLADRLRTELVNLNIFTVLERGQMHEILKEQGFNLTGCTTSECAVEAGRLLGVQQMVAGDVGKVGNVTTIDIRVFDVTTGKILNAYQYDHEDEASELLLLMREVARKISGLEEEGGFPWLWISLGTVVAVGVAALVLSKDSKETVVQSQSLPDPIWPPQD